MGRSPCCEKAHTNKGAWTKEEDQRLIAHIKANGEGCWRSLPKAAGLLRCGKSCRLRWINYLRPDLKRGNFTEEEDELIIKLHEFLGNKWSLIAGRLPGRTDNEIKNYWNTHVKRKLLARGVDPHTHRPLNEASAALHGVDMPSSPATASHQELAGGSSCSPVASGHSSEVDDGVTLLPPPAGHLGGMIDLNLSISPPCQPSSPSPMREAEARTVGDGAFRTGYASEREGICLCLNRLGLQGGVGCSCGGASPSPSLSSQVFNFRFVNASLQRS
uniref:Uncharacterized protein n=1 Tax=Avena sativa TaxID=4498 RepID=A0ACD5YKW0_AVESA